MSNNISFTIGNYTFDPAPQLSIGQRFNRTQSGEIISIAYTANMNGVLTDLKNRQCGASLGCSMGLINDLRYELDTCECLRMTIVCNGATLVDTNVRVQTAEFNQSNDNWVFTVPYQIAVEWQATEESGNTSSCGSCLTQINETWDIQELNGFHQYAFTDPA